MLMSALHPDHLTDLEKSGLTEDDARQAGLYTARPGDLHRLCGRPIPDNTSGLVFPYRKADGSPDEFARVKLFPPLVDAEEREIRYLQPSGTPTRAYFPPGVAAVLNSKRPLVIVEGEKKALAVTKAAVLCVGIGGIWNFASGGELIPDLKAIPWRKRTTRIIPDGDVWPREDLLLAVYRLACLLEAEGATVLVVKLPPSLPGMEKVGADDFLAAKGTQAFQRLLERAVTLRHPSFRPFREQEKREARVAKGQAPLPATLVGRRIHPSIHLDPDGFASIGLITVCTDGTPGTEIITSTRERFSTQAITSALVSPPLLYCDLLDRWKPENAERFLAGADEAPMFSDAVARIWDVLDRLVETRRECETSMLAVWALASYFHPVFSAFPRLDLRGERGSGKSKALSILAAITFNGLLRVSPTPAVLFRMAEALGPTLCLDEIEGLAGDEKREIQAILNSGYKAGGRVDRVEGDDRAIKSYAVYCPVALAGITGLNRVTEDRAITLVLAKGKEPTKLNADVRPGDPRFADIRDLCYRLALTRSRDVAETYQARVLPEWLTARDRELWLPLLTLATLAERENADLGVGDDLLTLAQEQAQERAGLSDEAAALVAILVDKLNGEPEIIVSPGDLCDDLQGALKLKEAPSPQRVGRWMKRLGFPAAPRSAGGKRRRVTAEALADLQKRYGEA